MLKSFVKLGLWMLIHQDSYQRKAVKHSWHFTFAMLIFLFEKYPELIVIPIPLELKTCGATRNPEFPRTGPDRNRSGVGEHFKEYFRVGSGNFIWGRSGSGYFFFTGAWNIFSRDFGEKLAFHSQTEEVEWLLSLISTLFDVITSLQGIFTCLL